jgi:hypothetical protein
MWVDASCGSGCTDKNSTDLGHATPLPLAVSGSRANTAEDRETFESAIAIREEA